MANDLGNHPCFGEAARHSHARVHLPVAPQCNVGCNFCDRRSDCLNESRPGVTSQLLSPQQALHYLEKLEAAASVPVSVVGIAGPGDPFATPAATLETLRLVRAARPELMLCVATNGLAIGPHIAELVRLRTSHVTITVNAVDPEIGARIYRFVRPGRFALHGVAGARELLACQTEAIRSLAAAGVTVKINTIVIPGVNDAHVETIAETVAGLGARVQNCVPLLPVPNTPFFSCGEPSSERMARLRLAASRHLRQMAHCTRCRADAAGLLGQTDEAQVAELLAESARLPLEGTLAARPYVAVASEEGVLVNQHLGEAAALHIFEKAPSGFALREVRPTPAPGSGDARWAALATLVADCRAVLCASAGQRPQAALAASGIRLLVAEGLIVDALEAVFSGVRPRMPARVACGTVTNAEGVGWGGCSGPGTGCG
jgi:nitrogen fixation protein NifB